MRENYLLLAVWHMNDRILVSTTYCSKHTVYSVGMSPALWKSISFPHQLDNNTITVTITMWASKLISDNTLLNSGDNCRQLGKMDLKDQFLLYIAQRNKLKTQKNMGLWNPSKMRGVRKITLLRDKLYSNFCKSQHQLSWRLSRTTSVRRKQTSVPNTNFAECLG